MGVCKRVARRCMGQDCQAFQGCRCPGCHFLSNRQVGDGEQRCFQIVRGVREQGIQLEKLQRLMGGLCQHLGDFLQLLQAAP